MSKRALIVEDNPVVRMQIADILAEMDMAVAEADSADEALALLADKTEINYLVTDVGITGAVDGLTIAKIVSDRRPGTRIVIVTGRDLQDHDIPQGAILLRKPFGMRNLEAALDQADLQHRTGEVS